MNLRFGPGWLLFFLSACGGGVPAGDVARFTVRGRWDAVTEVTYRFEPRGSPLGVEEVARELRRACAAWSNLSPIALREVGPQQTPDVLVSFERDVHGSCKPFGRDTSVAHAGPVRAGTFLHLDADRSWSLVEGAPGVSLRQTLLHELGHVLGLDHSPDPLALMHSDPTVDFIAHSDRCGLWTLYGGGEAGPGDLLVTRNGETCLALRGVAPPGLVAFELFDTDGDGDVELALWRTDQAGSGEFIVVHFGKGPRVVRTVGPGLGMAAPDAEVGFLLTPNGERLMLIWFPNGHRIARSFDREGRLQPFEIGSSDAAMNAAPPERRTQVEGDLDGDGIRETIRRR
jgi:hypothetical protein